MVESPALAASKHVVSSDYDRRDLRFLIRHPGTKYEVPRLVFAPHSLPSEGQTSSEWVWCGDAPWGREVKQSSPLSRPALLYSTGKPAVGDAALSSSQPHCIQWFWSLFIRIKLFSDERGLFMYGGSTRHSAVSKRSKIIITSSHQIVVQ